MYAHTIKLVVGFVISTLVLAPVPAAARDTTTMAQHSQVLPARGANNPQGLVGRSCPKEGVVRRNVYCAGIPIYVNGEWTLRVRLEWRARLTTVPAADQMLPKLYGNLPFESSLPPGLTPYELAERLARDWTALEACLNFAPEVNIWWSSQRVGPRTARCNTAVWGVEDARRSFETGKMTPREFYRPYTILYQKYEAYGATVYHGDCPEYLTRTGPAGWTVCTGFPYEYNSVTGNYDGKRLDYHVNYRTDFVLEYQGKYVRLTDASGDFLQDSRQRAEREGKLTVGDPARFEPAYWEVPGCPMWPDSYGRLPEHCLVMIPLPD